MQMEASKMELEIPSAEEPVATYRNFPLVISSLIIFSCIINVTRLFCLGQREVKCMYTCIHMIHKQFPTTDGLQSCCCAMKPCFRPTIDAIIQIMNTHPKDGELHWVTFATYESPVSGAVRLYDSGVLLLRICFILLIVQSALNL